MSDPTGPADTNWPRRALARLALSEAAAALADHATALVPTVNDEWARAGDGAEQAAQLVAAARELLDQAVVYERERGTSWGTIGEALDVTRQSAHERFAPILAEWESGLDEPWSQDGSIRNPRLPEGACDPDASAARLDRWCATHITEQTSGARHHVEQAGIADRMVSANLPRHTESSEAASLLRQARHLTEHGGTAEQREQYQARKGAVLRSIDGGQADHQPSQAGAKPAACTCRVTDPGGRHEVRHRDEQCPVHRGR